MTMRLPPCLWNMVNAMASIALSISASPTDIKALQDQIARAQNVLKKSPRDAITQAGYYICRSIGATAKVSKKLRPIVKNPDKRAETDGRMAKYGVERYLPNGEKKFVPIYRTGEFGKVRFLNKKTAQWLVRDKLTGEVTRETIGTGNGEFDIPGIQQSKKRIIRRRGLAKNSWKWMHQHVSGGGVGSVDGVASAATVDWQQDERTVSLRLTNHLRYMEAALRGGRQSVNTITARAAQAMKGALDKAVAKATGGAVK